MRVNLFTCKSHEALFNDIPPHKPPLQARSSPIPRIRIWPIRTANDEKYSISLACDWLRKKCLFLILFSWTKLLQYFELTNYKSQITQTNHVISH